VILEHTQHQQNTSFWLKINWWVVSHPLYIPNLAPCDFFVPRGESGCEREAFWQCCRVSKLGLVLPSQLLLQRSSQMGVNRNCSLLYKFVCICIYTHTHTHRLFHDLWTLLQEVISYVFVTKKVHINMCPILDGYGVKTA